MTVDLYYLVHAWVFNASTTLAQFLSVCALTFLTGYLLCFLNPAVALDKNRNYKHYALDLIHSVLVHLFSPALAIVINIFILGYNPADLKPLSYDNQSALLTFVKVVGFVLFWDIYFFIIHACLHFIRPLKRFHKDHHKRTVPNVFTSYNFSLTEFSVYVLFLQIMMTCPLSQNEITAIRLTIMGINIYGHSGFDFAAIHPSAKRLELLILNSLGLLSVSEEHFKHHTERDNRTFQQYIRPLSWVFDKSGTKG